MRYPERSASFWGGSRARGDAGPHSDVDFDILVREGPRDEWPSWFDGDVCVSTWIRDVDAWLAAQQESQDWAFGLPCADPLRLCWAADDAWRARLDVTHVEYPAQPPELEHFEGAAGKLANAALRGDSLALRLAARIWRGRWSRWCFRSTQGRRYGPGSTRCVPCSTSGSPRSGTARTC
jgi:hypothetical protein